MAHVSFLSVRGHCTKYGSLMWLQRCWILPKAVDVDALTLKAVHAHSGLYWFLWKAFSELFLFFNNVTAYFVVYFPTTVANLALLSHSLDWDGFRGPGDCCCWHTELWYTEMERGRPWGLRPSCLVWLFFFFFFLCFTQTMLAHFLVQECFWGICFQWVN